MQLIDTHAHLDEAAFDTDRGDVIQRAEDEGVSSMITIGTTADSSRLAVEIAAQHPPVFAAVGIQPNYAMQAKEGDWETICELARQPKVVAIGETGLDRYWDYAPFELQQDYFDRHIDLASEHDLPFVVHCREADADVIDQLRRASSRGPLKGVMHSFCGNLETANACLELGLYISFAGMLTYNKSEELREVAAQIPLDRLLVETDSPYLVPHAIRKQKGKGKARNEPAHIVYTAQCLADCLEMDVETLAQKATENARNLFGLPAEC